MKTRILVAIAMCVVFIPFLFFTDTVAFVILISLLSALAEFEMLRCLGLHKTWAVAVPAIAYAALAPFGARYLGTVMFLKTSASASALLMLFVFTVFTFSDDRVSLEQAGTTAAMTLYISYGFSFLVLLNDVRAYGFYLLLSVFIASWMTDTFAYFTGMLLGKHKLIPKISPKKTVEGSIGGIIWCVASFILFGFVVSKVTPLRPSYLVFAFAGLLGSLTSQAGDLLMSAIKRKRGIKDYGSIFPGHGGVLDRFDSVLAVSITLFFLESVFDFFIH